MLHYPYAGLSDGVGECETEQDFFSFVILALPSLLSPFLGQSGCDGRSRVRWSLCARHLSVDSQLGNGEGIVPSRAQLHLAWGSTSRSILSYATSQTRCYSRLQLPPLSYASKTKIGYYSYSYYSTLTKGAGFITIIYWMQACQHDGSSTAILVQMATTTE